MSDPVTIARNDLAWRIATDVLADSSRARELAEWFARENTDLGEAVHRLLTTARRAALIEAAEMCERRAKDRAAFQDASYGELRSMATRLRARAGE